MDILDLGVQASQHREQLEDVKRQVGVTHNHFDGWIYNFLENKHFNVEETVAKLQRRADMERNELATYVLTDEMLKDMRMGVIQLIGEDKEGRITFYITTKRDFPKSNQREVRKKVFDIWLSFGTRLRRDNKRCRIAMLINQEDASMWSNTDMGFQSNIALRISKFYPGVVDKMYVCKMGRALAAMAKPIFSALPQVVSEHIFIITDGDIKEGKLLQYYSPDVLPVPLGGKNNCDTKENWENFARIISDYWARLSAGLAAGKSVKDWELEQILAEEAAEKRRLGTTLSGQELPLDVHSPDTPNAGTGQGIAHRSRSHLTAQSHDADTADMLTCFSDDDELAEMEDVMLNFNPSASAAHPVIIDPFARLEYFMGRARYDIEKEEDIYRVALLMLCGSEGKAIGERERGDDLEEAHTHAALKNIPTTFRGLAKGALWVFCICISVYFFAATFFLTIVVSAMMTQLFYAAFVDWYNVWPLGVCAMLLGSHLTMILSRGFGLAITSFRGHVIQPLGNCGTGGFVTQMTFFVLVMIAQLIIFIYYASTVDPVSGARIAFSTGWMSCTIIICIFHLFFPLGLRENNVVNRNGGGSLSLYLFYDITEQDNPPRTRRSAIAISLVPAAVSLLFGIGYMASELFIFIIATPIAFAITAVCIAFFAHKRDKDFGAPVISVNAWLLCFMWVWVSIVSGTMDLKQSWVASVATTCSVVGFLALLCVVLVNIRTRKMYLYAVKLNYLLFSVLFVACVVASYWVHWGFILIMLALMIHFLLSTTQHQASNLAGDAVGVLGPLVMFCCIILLGHAGIQETYTEPRSYGDVVMPKGGDVPFNHHRYPVCLSRYASNATISDLALFAELVQAEGIAFEVDKAAWFPDYIFKGVAADEPSLAKVYEFESPSGDIVLAFRSPTQRMLALLSLTLWTESISFYPIAFSIPNNWIPRMINFFGYVDKLVAFPSKAALNRLNEVIIKRAETGKRVVLTGHGIGGATAAVLGSKNKMYAVAFSSPGLEYSRLKFDLPEDLADYLTEVKTSNDALGGIDSHGDLVMSFKCEEGIMKCSNIQYIALELMRVCGDGNNRTHNQRL